MEAEAKRAQTVNAEETSSGYAGLALDLDGTLLTAKGGLSKASVERLRRLRDRGVQIILISGRMTPAIVPFWQEIGLDTPIVAYNGAKIGVPGQPPLYEVFLASVVANQVIAYCRHRDLPLNIYIHERLYALSDSEAIRWYSDYFRIPFALLPLPWVEDCQGATKLLVISSVEEVADNYRQIKTLFGAQAQITTSSRCFVEILPHGVNKGAALRQLAEHLRLPLPVWVAVGDGANDVEMLTAAGCGIAIDDGDEVAKAAAKMVTPSLDYGGWEKICSLFG